jgi:excisionase family DNA binding protein
MAPPSLDSDLLTLQEAALRLRVSKNTVYKLCRAGQIPSCKVGRQWRIRGADLDHWLSQPPSPVDARPGAGRDRLESLISGARTHD